MKVRTVRRDTDGPNMQSLTCCKANRTRGGVRKDTAGPGMLSLTCCNRTRVGVRKDTAGPGMQ